MSVQNKKFRGFADLYAVEKRKQKESAKDEPADEQPQPVPAQKDKVRTGRTSKPLPTTGGDSPPLPTTGDQSPPLPTTPQLHQKETVESVAPNRDFNKRANSLERDALPSGLFPGTTKKLYDALYLRTRGAVKPTTSVRASRRDLLLWTGIRNLKTIDSHIRYLMASGLIIRHWELGSNEGSIYEVKVPEEIGRYQYPPLPTTGGESPLPPVTTSTHDQKTGSGYTQKTGSGGEGYLLENTDGYDSPKTFIKTNTDDDYTHTLAEFTKTLAKAARDVCGDDYSFTEQEQERWRELASVLVDELKKAVSRTEQVSSVPAFFSAHLRRCFTRKTAQQGNEGTGEKSSKKAEARLNRAQESVVKRVESKDDEGEAKSSGGSKFTLEQCLSYAEHLHETGQGIVNPGGFAIAIHRSGMADPLVERFLNKGQKSSVQDTKACPDCRGTGFYYPKGAENGVVKCKHERLAEGDSSSFEPSEGRRLTAEEIGEQAGIIAELVEGGYTIEQAEAQFGASVHAEDWQKIIAQIERKGGE